MKDENDPFGKSEGTEEWPDRKEICTYPGCENGRITVFGPTGSIECPECKARRDLQRDQLLHDMMRRR